MFLKWIDDVTNFLFGPPIESRATRIGVAYAVASKAYYDKLISSGFSKAEAMALTEKFISDK